MRRPPNTEASFSRFSPRAARAKCPRRAGDITKRLTSTERTHQPVVRDVALFSLLRRLVVAQLEALFVGTRRVWTDEEARGFAPATGLFEPLFELQVHPPEPVR